MPPIMRYDLFSCVSNGHGVVREADSEMSTKFMYDKTDSKHRRHMSRRMRKPTICVCQSKRRRPASCVVTAKLISAFVFATKIVQLLFFLNLLAIFCGCTGRFVMDLGGNLEDRFSHVTTHIRIDTIKNPNPDIRR